MNWSIRTSSRAVAAFFVGFVIANASANAPGEELSIQNESLKISATDDGAFRLLAGSTNKQIADGKLEDVRGAAKGESVDSKTFGKGEAIVWSNARIELFPKLPFALFRRTLTNDGADTKTINHVDFASLNLDVAPSGKSIKTMGTGGLLAPDKNSGSYTWIAVAEPESRNTVVAAWLTQDRASGVFFTGKLTPEKGEPSVFVKARTDYGRLNLAPGKSEETETLAVGYFDDGRLGLEAYADGVAKVYDIKLPPAPSGFCTWYAEKPYGGAANEGYIATLTEFVKKNLQPFGLSFIQIDDGWQQGEKINGPKKNFTNYRSDGPYKSGMKKTADTIRSAGLTAGIWFMPFAGTFNDPWFKDHQDWFTKGPEGKPFDLPWGGTCLDTTRPDVREYIRGMVNTIANDWGYRYFKLDGLYTGMSVEPRYVNSSFKDDNFGNATLTDPNKTSVEMYRDGLKLIRETAGPGLFILGCNTAQNMRTLGASFGVMEAMRIGPDNKGTWKDWSARSPVSGSRFYFLNGRVWYNDPDPNYERSSIEFEDARTIATWSAISGQLNTNSDWIPDFSPERLNLLKRTIASHGKTARPVDYFENDPPRIWVVTDEQGTTRRDVIAFFNWSDKDEEMGVKAERAGLPKADEYALFDYWDNKFLPNAKGEIKVKVPKHGCKVIAVRPTRDAAFVISTSQHVTQGMLDIVSESDLVNKSETGGKLAGTSKIVGNDPYEILIATRQAGKNWKVTDVDLSQEDKAAGATIKFDQADDGARATITSPQDRTVSWTLRFGS
jgi:hypothetical protein